MAKTKTKEKLSLEDIEEHFVKEYGKGFIVTGEDIGSVQRVSTGHVSIDKALGGGIPRGRITEISGANNTGKTLIALATVASAQRAGGCCLYIDVEKSFDSEWAQKNGVDLSTLKIIQPSYGEQAWEAVEHYMASGEVDVIVLDSIAACVPKAELDGEFGDASIGLQARLNSKAMRIITSYFGAGEEKNQRTALILINQERANMAMTGYGGSPTTTSGGKALPFYMAVRIQLRRIGWITKGDDKLGAVTRMTLTKSKVTGVQPQASVEFEVDFKTGLDFAKDILNHGVVKGWVKKAGAWYTIYDQGQEIQKLQGEIETKAYIRSSGLMEKWRNDLLNES